MGALGNCGLVYDLYYVRFLFVSKQASESRTLQRYRKKESRSEFGPPILTLKCLRVNPAAVAVAHRT